MDGKINRTEEMREDRNPKIISWGYDINTEGGREADEENHNEEDMDHPC